MSQHEVAIAYRVYPGVSKTPLIHANNKLALATTCLASFKEALGDVRAKMFVLLDSCPPEYYALFRRYFADEDLAFIELGHVGNQESFLKQIEVLLDQNDSEAVYFAEDDYLYLPNTFREMLNAIKVGIKGERADFVTPYDHSDYYSLLLHRHDREFGKKGDREWQTVNSSCLTFLTTKTTLRETRAILETYRNKKNLDASIWLSLTHYQIFNPVVYLTTFLKERSSFKILLKAWIYNGPRLLGRRYRLWSPKPSLATHTDHRYPAPGIDWQTAASRIDAEIAATGNKP
jgi:hypothetical protein